VGRGAGAAAVATGAAGGGAVLTVAFFEQAADTIKRAKLVNIQNLFFI
jgi:hypothetical protein